MVRPTKNTDALTGSPEKEAFVFLKQKENNGIMSPSIINKLKQFHLDSRMQARFLKSVLAAPFEDLILPGAGSAVFGREFMVRYEGSSVPFPLIDDAEKIRCIAWKIRAAADGQCEGAHPLLLYYWLDEYQKKFQKPPAVKKSAKRPMRKIKGRKKAATKARVSDAKKKQEHLRVSNFRDIQKIKNSLSVPAAFKKSRDGVLLKRAIFAELQKSSREAAQTRSSLAALSLELDKFKKNDYVPEGAKKRIEELTMENTDLLMRIRREETRADALEGEVSRLADQIISGPVKSSGSSEEAETLRRELALTSQKYDSLVSKNIELSNRLQKVDQAKNLEDVLNLIRDKINGVLRAGVRQSDDILLKSIQGEIAQVQRARAYLGKALYDVGMLYLRIGEKDRALQELRAARELGVQDPEINRILNSHGS